ncbi:hypothetical protein P4O66_001353 [Electrophorus voltai]|uniref:Tf2-1-like SH3-like domain-containing protein n=1 Tax=Electrophorus voltai TaxID=2609070 RepID=A0AAD8Z861_9TELE|nr:hypothetical protein P4O66_001353 [Electrophorus voltai]
MQRTGLGGNSQETVLCHRGLQKKGRPKAGSDSPVRAGTESMGHHQGWPGGPLALWAKYEGPYTITSRVNEVTYRLGLPGHSQASRAFHVSALKPVVEGPLSEKGGPLGAPPMLPEIRVSRPIGCEWTSMWTSLYGYLPCSSHDARPTGAPVRATILGGLPLLNPAPEMELAPEPPQLPVTHNPTPVLGPYAPESLSEPRKKYAKEAWPGKKPTPSLLL